MKYYSIDEVRMKLGISRQRVHQLIGRGDIIAEKVGKFRIISESELTRIIKKRKQRNV